MKKIILWSVVSILVIGILAASIWWLRRPQFIVLSDGTKLTLLGVDYGKHHKVPTVKPIGRRMNGGESPIDTTNDTFFVWILSEHKANQWPNYQVVAYDKAETACVTSQSSNSRQIKTGMEIMGIQLNAFPRHDRNIYLRIMNYGQRGQQVAKGQFVVANPVRGKIFPKWTPDPLPNTQSDGDLDVTLTKLADAPSPYNRGNGIPKNDPINKTVQITFDLQQKGQSVTNWRPVSVQTTDATGNDVKGWINEYRMNGKPDGYFYQPGLWPGESAWKVRLEFSRIAGFSNDELWSITNLPVHAGSQQDMQNSWSWGNQGNSRRAPAAFAETTVNDVHVKIFPAIQYASQNMGNGNGNNKVVGIIINTDPDVEASGMRLTPLSVTDDQGRQLNNQGTSWGGGNFQYEFAEPRTIESMSITLALHKSRFVEFTVKPQKAAATGP